MTHEIAFYADSPADCCDEDGRIYKSCFDTAPDEKRNMLRPVSGLLHYLGTVPFKMSGSSVSTATLEEAHVQS